MKKKIAVLSPQVPFTFGGTELHVNSLTENLRKRGYDAELIRLPFKWYPENSLYDSMMLWRMLDLSESDGQKIDLVIGTKFPSYGVRHENKVVWLIHQFRQVYDLYDTQYGYGSQPGGDRIREIVKHYDDISLGEAKRIYANSGNVKARLKKYNGIDSEPLYHPPLLAGKYHAGDAGDYILSVGRLNPLKRHDLLLHALSKCGRGIRAKIAGAGSELDNLRALARRLGISDRVDFCGFVSDEELTDLYAGAFAVYFAPVDEDYGYITLEAFLSRKPVITCSDAGGPLEFVTDGENGCICDPVAEELAGKISALFEHRARAKAYGIAGYELVRDISWDHVIDELTRSLR